jgi:hypothetical protein
MMKESCSICGALPCDWVDDPHIEKAMTTPSPTQAERAREIAHRIVADFRPEGWSAKEEEITRLIISAFAEQCATDRLAVVEECAAKMRDAIGRGYSVPTNKVDKCEHGKFGWEDCIACYDVALVRAISALSKEHNHVEG